MRQIFWGLLAIAGAAVGVANLFCVAAYGNVFLVRGSDWADFDTSPTRFTISVFASLIGAPACAALGIFAIKGARDERRFFERLYTDRPRYEDDTHTHRTES